MFLNREEGGIQLAGRLTEYKEIEGGIILGLPRGGVVTGFEIARSLHLPLDVLIVRKIGAPLQPELAVGAISETGTIVLNQNVISTYHIPEDYIKDSILREKEEIARRITLYRRGKGIRDLTDNMIILVDDGVATGATIKAAITTLKKEKIKELIVALPVAPPEVAMEIKAMVDKFICIETPSYFMAVGNHYIDFHQVSDREVVEMLQRSIYGDKAGGG